MIRIKSNTLGNIKNTTVYNLGQITENSFPVLACEDPNKGQTKVLLFIQNNKIVFVAYSKNVKDYMRRLRTAHRRTTYHTEVRVSNMLTASPTHILAIDFSYFYKFLHKINNKIDPAKLIVKPFRDNIINELNPLLNNQRINKCQKIIMTPRELQ